MPEEPESYLPNLATNPAAYGEPPSVAEEEAQTNTDSTAPPPEPEPPVKDF